MKCLFLFDSRLLCGVLLLAVLLPANADGQTTFGEEKIISTSSDLALSVFCQDLDGDGDADVVSASSLDDKIAWYPNDGSGNFGDQIIISTDADGASDVFCQDLDGDGDVDVVSASSLDHKIAWYPNDGTGSFGEEITISTDADNARGVFCQDLDGDGDADVVSASFSDNKLAWYPNDGTGSFGEEIIISTDADGAHDVFCQDLDGDGDVDVVSANAFDHTIAWYPNDGNGNFGDQITISTDADNARGVFCQDLDGDGDADVVSASHLDDKIAWYPNDGIGNFGDQIIISTDADQATSVFCQDLDGDGDADVVSASMVDDKIAWYPNDGIGNFGDQIIISTDANGAWRVFCQDLDGDGDADVVSASQWDDKVAWYENLIGEGCTDPVACNYDPDSWIDNGSCCFGNCGCNDPNSLNYEPGADCDDGSCSYVLSGIVFYDEDEDGVLDEGEIGLPFQEVTLTEVGVTLITNDAGAFFTIVEPGEGSAVVTPSDTFPFVTTDNPLTYEGSEASFLELGLSNEEPIYGVCIDLYPSGNTFLCNDWSNHNICFRNMSTETIDGLVTLEIDPMFQGWQEVTPIDSTDGNTVYMSFENLQPGVMYMYDILLNTPTVDFIGETAVSSVTIDGYNAEGTLVASGTQVLETEVLCAYDPNDKQAFPLGYGDDHRLLPGTEQEYLVRFQNTGNAPAQDVVIVDTLDINFDLETFEIVANSHSMSAVINEVTREVQFQFFDIQLPDSTCCEEDSHGLVSYKIRSLPGLEPETRLENTAYIFFDNNDPIITNTTWTTVHACQEEVTLATAPGGECPIQNSVVSSDYITYPGLDNDFYWTSDAGFLGGDDTQQLPGLYSGGVQLTVDNPLCTNTASLDWTNPDPGFVWLTCPGDLNCDGLINATDVVGLLGQYGCDALCLYEVTGDGKVDSEDMLVVLGAFGTGCE